MNRTLPLISIFLLCLCSYSWALNECVATSDLAITDTVSAINVTVPAHTSFSKPIIISVHHSNEKDADTLKVHTVNNLSRVELRRFELNPGHTPDKPPNCLRITRIAPIKVGKLHEKLEIFPGTQYFYHLWNYGNTKEVISFEVLKYSMCGNKRKNSVAVLGPQPGKSTASFASDHRTRFSVFSAYIPQTRDSYDIELTASTQVARHRPPPYLTGYMFNQTSKHCSVADFRNGDGKFVFVFEHTVAYLPFPRGRPKHANDSDLVDYTLALNASGSPNLKASFKYLPVCVDDSENSISHTKPRTSFRAFGLLGNTRERHTVSVDVESHDVQKSVVIYANTTNKFPDKSLVFNVFSYYKDDKSDACLLSSVNQVRQKGTHAGSMIPLPAAKHVSLVIHSAHRNIKYSKVHNAPGFKVHVGFVQDCPLFATSSCTLTGDQSLFLKLDVLAEAPQRSVVTYTCHESRKATVTVRRMDALFGSEQIDKSTIHLSIHDGAKVHNVTLGASDEVTFQLAAAGETVTIELVADESLKIPSIVFVNFMIDNHHPGITLLIWIITLTILVGGVYCGYQVAIYYIMKRELAIEQEEQNMGVERVLSTRNWRYQEF
eukprot:144376_1